MNPTQAIEKIKNTINAQNVPELISLSLQYSASLRASDIHIEPEKHNVKVRVRIDGILKEIYEYPLPLHDSVITRLKIMSNLKIDEQRIPQDGRIDFGEDLDQEIQLRVSTFPTVNGEKVVMRIQDKSKKVPSLEKLGFLDRNHEIMKDALSKNSGIVLVTGPTGSGKTTTLYSALSILNKPEVNILTIEDPVEIQMNGINQSQVFDMIDYNFATGLKSALRQDPDIIMVGEIRDSSSLDTAIKASLTGHLVLSTVHTNSSVETITRLLNMDTLPYLIASSVELIVAQRLVRKICPYCKVDYELPEDVYKQAYETIKDLHARKVINDEDIKKFKTMKGAGCNICHGTGYRGRIGLYEALQITPKIKQLINKQATSSQLLKAAQEEGMTTLYESGILLVLYGATSFEEVMRVT